MNDFFYYLIAIAIAYVVLKQIAFAFKVIFAAKSRAKSVLFPSVPSNSEQYLNEINKVIISNAIKRKNSRKSQKVAQNEDMEFPEITR